MQIRHNTFGDLRIFSSEMYDLWRRIGELEVAQKKKKIELLSWCETRDNRQTLLVWTCCLVSDPFDVVCVVMVR